MRALIRCVRMPWVSAFISNHTCQAVTSESWVIGQNVNQVREKITEFSGLKHFVSSLASQNRDFWLQMAITQRRNIKDVQILAFTEQLKLNVTPKYKTLDQKPFFRVGKNMSKGVESKPKSRFKVWNAVTLKPFELARSFFDTIFKTSKSF